MGQSGGSDFKQTGMKQFSTQSAIIQDGDVFQGDSINPDRMPERKEELETIHSVIEPAARGDSPRNLFIYGKPGQGKTAAVKIKREQYEEFARANDLDIRMVYVECKSAKKSYHVLTTLLKKLKGLDSKPKGIQLDDLYTRLYEYM